MRLVETDTEPLSDNTGPAEKVESDDSMGWVLKALENLGEDQREAIRLKFQHGLSYQQIANVTKLSVSNVGYLIHTGLKTLRERLRVNSDERNVR